MSTPARDALEMIRDATQSRSVPPDLETVHKIHLFAVGGLALLKPSAIEELVPARLLIEIDKRAARSDVSRVEMVLILLEEGLRRIDAFQRSGGSGP